MYKTTFTLLFLCSICISSIAQLHDSVINKLSIQLEESFIKTDTINEGFSPSNMLYANLDLFEAKNSYAFKTIRQLVINGKFKNEDAVLKWLTPLVNKRFMQRYSQQKNPAINQYQPILEKISVSFCNCIFKAKTPKGIQLTDEIIFNCANEVYGKDTAFTKSYFNFLQSLNSDDLKGYLMGMVQYSQVNCPANFELTNTLVKLDLYTLIEKTVYSHQFTILQQAVKLQKEKKTDSLKAIFKINPTSTAILSTVGALFEKYPLVTYTSEIVFEGSDFLRFSSFIVSVNAKNKITLLGQAVYELSTKEALYPIRNLKFYNRASVQDAEKLEKELQQSYNKESR